MNLCSKTILAASIRHAGCFRLGSSIKTGERHAIRDWASVLVGHGRFVVGASEGVTREHTEARRKGFDVRSGVTAAEVVDCHARSHDFLERTIGMLVVEKWSPVGRFISLDLA